MVYNSTFTKADDVNIAYIGGGSKGWAWTLMSDLACDLAMNGTIKLYDIDYSAARQNEVIGNKFTKNKLSKGKWKYIAVNSIEEALEEADFVIISILPGTLNEMDSDVHTPEQYGIYQSVGDTTGPGGMVRALRTVPMFVTIAEAIRLYSPNAWVINYTNPMTVCVQTLYRTFPKIKAFGCCHEVFGTEQLLADMLGKSYGIEGVSRQDINVNVLGINHFTWFNKASYRGLDLMPLYDEFVQKNEAEGVTFGAGKNWMNDTFVSAEKVKFDLYNKYGWIAAAGDRHLAEFLEPTYLSNPATVAEWKFGLTTVEQRREEEALRIKRAYRITMDEEIVTPKSSGEEGVLLMKSLLGLTETISNVNIPNYGQIPNIPKGAVVETNAVFRKDSIMPVFAGEVKEYIYKLMKPHIESYAMIIEAAINKDKDMAYRAFVNQPLIKAKLNSIDERRLFDKMLFNTKEYLPGWKL